jgi:hypothetical protein
MDFTASPAERALARFLRALALAATEAAEEIEVGSRISQGSLSLAEAGLGSLQHNIATTPGMDTETGISPREITHQLDRGDEPNVRTALAAMAKRGITELVPGAAPQRWRLTRPYAAGAGLPLYEFCERCGYPFAGPTIQQFCRVKSACDQRLREPGYRVPNGRQQNLAIRARTLADHPELGPLSP